MNGNRMIVDDVGDDCRRLKGDDCGIESVKPDLLRCAGDSAVENNDVRVFV